MTSEHFCPVRWTFSAMAGDTTSGLPFAWSPPAAPQHSETKNHTDSAHRKETPDDTEWHFQGYAFFFSIFFYYYCYSQHFNTAVSLCRSQHFKAQRGFKAQCMSRNFFFLLLLWKSMWYVSNKIPSTTKMSLHYQNSSSGRLRREHLKHFSNRVTASQSKPI